ncbi:MAG: DUF2066 domain-containing protein [Inquilinaceae bacterium]
MLHRPVLRLVTGAWLAAIALAMLVGAPAWAQVEPLPEVEQAPLVEEAPPPAEPALAPEGPEIQAQPGAVVGEPVETPQAPVIAAPTGADIYTVSGIEVEGTGATSSAARDSAFAQGQRLALAALIDRVAGPGAALDVATVSDQDVGNLLRSFRVEEERVSAGRYAATLSFDFWPDAVRDLLRQRAVTYTDTPSRPILVLPIYRSEGGQQLWDGINPWLDAWLDVPARQRLVPLVVPFGELQDVSTISVGQALSGDREALRRIADLHRAGDVLVAVADPGPDGVAVTLNRYGQDGDLTTGVLTVAEPEALEDRLAGAVEQVAGELEDRWRTETQVAATGPTSGLSILVPIVDAEDWFQTRARLDGITAIANARVLSLTPAEAVLALEYRGTESQLRLALAQQNLTLDQGPFAPILRRTDR